MADPLARQTPNQRRRIGGKSLLLMMLGVIVLVVALAVVVPTFVMRGGAPELDNHGTVPAFELVDESGEVFTEEALRGHPTIVNFIFTRCDTVCPVTAMKTEKLQARTADRKGVAIKFLSISVDPTYDTPAKLAEFAERYKADPSRWRLVTGKPETIKRLVTDTFMTPMDTEGKLASGAPNIVHSGYFFLVDADLQIRKFYDSNDLTKLDEMIRAARYLARISEDRGYKFGGG